MTAREAFDDLLLLVSVENANQAYDFVRKDVLRCINAALQLIQLSPTLEHYSRQNVSITTVAGTYDYALAKNIQNVIGPASINGLPLRNISSLGDFYLFPALYLGANDGESDNAQPVAYYVHTARDITNAGGDNVTSSIMFQPTPDGVYTVVVYVKKEATRFSLSDLCDSNNLIPIPHNYAESCFLPVARWAVTKSRYFTEKDRIPVYRTDYLVALDSLGLTDPNIIAKALAQPGDAVAQEVPK